MITTSKIVKICIFILILLTPCPYVSYSHEYFQERTRFSQSEPSYKPFKHKLIFRPDGMVILIEPEFGNYFQRGNYYISNDTIYLSLTNVIQYKNNCLMSECIIDRIDIQNYNKFLISGDTLLDISDYSTFWEWAIQDLKESDEWRIFSATDGGDCILKELEEYKKESSDVRFIKTN